ncbi:MAG: tRNA pseudouridine(38-40) synthase TruA [Polyangiaceae bacterium]
MKAIRGSSRTDAGVHARDQCVAFDPAREMPPRAWQHWINRELSAEIAIRGASSAPRGFEPRFHSVEKTYRYLVLLDPERDPLFEARAWRLHDVSLDAIDDAVTRVQSELEALVGEHDFAAFRSASDPRTETIRTIFAASASRGSDDPRLLTIEVSGSGFMHNMVRIIVGAAVDVARGRLAPGAIARGLETKQRTALGITAPPDGLYLYATRLELP